MLVITEAVCQGPRPYFEKIHSEEDSGRVGRSRTDSFSYNHQGTSETTGRGEWAGGQVDWKQDPTLKKFHSEEGSGRVGRSQTDSFGYNHQETSGTAGRGWAGGQVAWKQDPTFKIFHFNEVGGQIPDG